MSEAPKIGRPSTYTPELVEEFFYRVGTGRSVRDVCEDDDMPGRRTIWDWQNNKPEFASRLVRVRTESVETDLDEMRGLSSRVLKEKGLDPKRVRVALDALDKAARLRRPRQVELTGAGGGPIRMQAFDPAKLAQLSEEELNALERAHRIIGLAAGNPGGEGAEEISGAA